MYNSMIALTLLDLPELENHLDCRSPRKQLLSCPGDRKDIWRCPSRCQAQIRSEEGGLSLTVK